MAEGDTELLFVDADDGPEPLVEGGALVGDELVTVPEVELVPGVEDELVGVKVRLGIGGEYWAVTAFETDTDVDKETLPCTFCRA